MQIRSASRRTHVGPDDSAVLASWVCSRSHPIFECIFRRLVRHVHTGALRIELPPVINTSKAALFVTTPEQAGSTMRTKLIEQSDSPVAIAKGDEIFPKQANPHRWTIRCRQLS